MRVADVSEDVLRQVVQASASWAEVKRRCGLSRGGAVQVALRRRLEALGIGVSHLERPSTRYSDAELRELVSRANSVADVLRALGLPQAGGSHAHLSRRIRALGCDTTHFGRRPTVQRPAVRLAAEDLLVRRPSAERRRTGALLTRALLQVGRLHVCAGCGTGPTWNGQPLVLSVDHVDGDWRNDTAENLRFLCPNCHSQTPTFCRPLCARGDSNPHALSGTSS